MLFSPEVKEMEYQQVEFRIINESEVAWLWLEEEGQRAV